MVKAGERDGAFASAGRPEHRRPGFRMRDASLYRPPDGEPRIACASHTRQPNAPEENAGRSVATPLPAFANVVDECGREEFCIGFRARDQPARRGRSMDDVPRVLGEEQCEKRWAEKRACERLVGRRRLPPGFEKLAQPLPHQFTKTGNTQRKIGPTIRPMMSIFPPVARGRMNRIISPP